jgi:hypothetical protein
MFLCKDATLRMTDARDGALRGLTALRYRAHLLMCAHCRACRRQLDDTIALAAETRGAQREPRERDGDRDRDDASTTRAVEANVVAALRAKARSERQ